MAAGLRAHRDGVAIDGVDFLAKPTLGGYPGHGRWPEHAALAGDLPGTLAAAVGGTVIYAIPLLFLTGGMILGVVLARWARWGAFWSAQAAAVVLASLLYVSAQGKNDGWDALATFLPAVLLLAPMTLGMLLGAVVVRLRGR